MQNEYLIEKGKSESPEDLVGRLLFELVSLERAKQNEKELDLSQVIDALLKINKANSSAVWELDELRKKNLDIESGLAAIAEILIQNKPQDVEKLIFTLREEIGKIKLDSEVRLAGPIEIAKPIWWKEFTFSWKPLEKLIEKLKSYTFSVKVENQLEKEPPLDIDTLAKKIAKELGKEIGKLPRGGGMGNPFTFDDNGNLKVLSGSSEGYVKVRIYTDPTYTYIAEAAPGTETNANGWRVCRIESATGNKDWADGNVKYDNVADDYASLNYS